MTYARVVASLGESREEVLARFALAGGNRERWVTSDKAAMAAALTRAEDRLELRRGANAERAREALRPARRALEEFCR